MPTLSPAIMDIITNAANQQGVSPNVLSYIAQVESGGNPNARNPKSSAGGLFQFIDSTANQYGLQDKFNPEQSSSAAARLLKDNSNFLAKKLGREPTQDELYLAHQQGAQGAYNLISNPNARAYDLVGNAAISLNRGNPDMTAAQFVGQWKKGDSGNAVGRDVPSYSGTGTTPAESGTTTLTLASEKDENNKQGKKNINNPVKNLLGRALSGQSSPVSSTFSLSQSGQQGGQGLASVSEAQASGPLQALLSYLRSV